MKFVKSTHLIDATYPRKTEFCTASGRDKLKVAFNVYTATNPPTDKRPLNLIFAHGNGMHKDIFDYMIRQFFDSPLGPSLKRVVAIDSANQCDSHMANEGKLGATTFWSDCGRDICRIVRSVGLTDDINILIGHSMGGTQCMFAAYFEPMLFDSVVALDPIVYAEEGYRESPMKEAVRSVFDRVEQKLQDHFPNEQAYWDYMTKSKLGMPKKFHPEVQKIFVQSGARYNGDGTVSYKTPDRQQMITYNMTPYAYEDALKMINCLNCEVLHVAGTVFNLVSPRSAPKCRNALRFCTPVDIEGGNHLVPFEMADETFEAILPFVTRRYKRGLELKGEFDRRKAMSPEERAKFIRARREELYANYPDPKGMYAKL